MTILLALSIIVRDQANSTEATMKRVRKLIDYMVSHPRAIIRYYALGMVLNVHSNASYMSAGKGRSHTGGYFFLGSMIMEGKPIQLNGNVHITCAILKLVPASAAEA